MGAAIRLVILPCSFPSFGFAVSQKKTIFQKFLEKGHTWMEVESVHSAIEGKLRGRQIFWPAGYSDVITVSPWARYQNPPPHLGGYSKMCYKKLFTHVESHASAVSLLESGE